MSSASMPRPEGVDPDDVDVRHVEAYLEDLARLAAAEVGGPGVEVSCGVTIKIDDQRTTVACSDTWAIMLDEIQYEVGMGPCLESILTDSVVHISDVPNHDTWPEWQARAHAAGLGSTFAAPVPLKGSPTAALNFYARPPDAFDDAAIERGRVMAGRAVAGINLVARLVEQESHAEQMRAALGSRSVIDQALGIIMAQNRCDADEAFGIIRKVSHNRNVKLRQIAVDIITSATGKVPVPPPAFRR